MHEVGTNMISHISTEATLTLSIFDTGLLSELRPDLPPEMTNHMADWKWKKYNVYFEDEDKEPI